MNKKSTNSHFLAQSTQIHVDQPLSATLTHTDLASKQQQPRTWISGSMIGVRHFGRHHLAHVF
jgi:hypothetical protein